MKAQKITEKQGWEILSNPFLKKKFKKDLGITGYKLARDWYIVRETDLAILIEGLNRYGIGKRSVDTELTMWLPKSQVKILEYFDEVDECDVQFIFVKTWLYNKHDFSLNRNLTGKF